MKVSPHPAQVEIALSRDPLGEYTSANLYEYAEDDVIDLLDPFGLSACRINIVVAHYTGGLSVITQNMLNGAPDCQIRLGVIGCGANGANDALNKHGNGVPGMPQNNSTEYGDTRTEALAKKYNVPKTDIDQIYNMPAQIQAALAAARAEAKKNCATNRCKRGTTIHVSIIGNTLRKAVEQSAAQTAQLGIPQIWASSKRHNRNGSLRSCISSLFAPSKLSQLHRYFSTRTVKWFFSVLCYYCYENKRRLDNGGQSD